MKILLIATLLALASCAANSSTPQLEDRLASWVGSPIADLERELGEPTTIEEDKWEWRLTAPGMASATSTYSPTGPLGAYFAKRAGSLPDNTSADSDSSIQRKECIYRAVLDEESIVRIETYAVSGRCLFGEVPLRTKG